VLGDALKVGIPAGLQAAIVAISNVFLQSVINTFGKHAVAGYTAATRSDGFVFVVINGLALAVMTFVGVNMGAGRYDRVKRGLKESLALTFVVIVSVSAVIILFRYPIASLFNSDPDVIRYSTRTMMFILSFYWLFALCEVMGGLLRGIGHSIYPMVISLVCMAGVRLVWIAIVLPTWNSYDGLLMAYPVSWLVSFIAYIAYLKLKRGIFPKENEEADGVMAPEAEA
jgi:Na+-driven multidrug efflux pump